MYDVDEQVQDSDGDNGEMWMALVQRRGVWRRRAITTTSTP
jgi:hypothetical protein